jgi:hypothetical protein
MKRAAPTVLLAATVLGAAACAQILGFKKAPERPFEHRAHALEGIHCLQCHKGISGAGDDGPLHLPGTDDCKGCHAEPHDDRDCAMCHGVSSTRGAAERAKRVLSFSHSEHVRAASGDCVQCHVDAGIGGPTLRPRMGVCLGCHEHREQFDTNRCEPCHVDLKNEGTLPEDHLAHGPNFLREHGLKAAADPTLCANCHSERQCAGCHAGDLNPITPERMAFSDPFSAGVHRAGFLARHAEEARGDPGLCTTCHAPSACTECHREKRLEASAPSSRNPHPPGWVSISPSGPNEHGRATWRDPMSCETCHGGAGEALCVGCHQVGAPGGNPHPPGWSPGRSAKTSAPCVRCHTGGR